MSSNQLQDPFWKISYLSSIEDTLLQGIAMSNPEDWIQYYSFDTLPVPGAILMKDPLLDWLHRRHPFTAGILSMKPHSYYNWHTDSRRGVCLNMIVGQGGHHHSMFSDGDNLTGNFTELKYEPGVYYIFDNQVRHTVYNFDKPRWLFSTEFAEDKDSLTFEMLAYEISELMDELKNE